MVTVKQFKENGFKFVVDDELALSGNQKATYNLMPADLSAIKEEQERYNNDFVINLDWRRNTGVQPVGDDCWVEVEQYNGAKKTVEAVDVYWENDHCFDADIYKWKPSLKHLEQQMNDNQETKTALEMSERDIENYADDFDVERELKESDEVNGCVKPYGDYEMNCLLNDANESITISVERIKDGDLPDKYIDMLEKCKRLIEYAIDNSEYNPENGSQKLIELGYEFYNGEWLSSEEKEARDREEAAIELHDLAQDAYFDGRDGTASWDKAPDRVKKMYYAIVDKTGYRK